VNSDLLELGVALGLAAALYVAVAAFVWSHRRAVGARALTVLLLAAGTWTICGAVEISLLDPQSQELWGDVKYLGIVALPPALLAFALQYTGRRRRLGRATVGLLAIEPVVVLLAIWLPPTHRLVRYVPADAAYGEFAVARAGPLFWVHAVYSYVLIVVALTLLVLALLKVSRRFARAWLLIASALLPLVINAVYLLGLTPRLAVDPTPLAFSLTGMVLVWGFFRFRLLELIPVGRKQVVEQIPDGVVVLDLHNHVVDANPATGRLTGMSTGQLVGLDLLDVLPQLSSLLGSTEMGGHAFGSCRAKRADGATVDLAVTISPLPDAVHAPTGRLVVLRDVTAQRDVERRLRDLVAERTATLETLQRGLYPARVPDIPGLSVAAVLDPAEADTSIGGDFVDIRQCGDERWCLMVGDVVGKGAAAATLTGVARHTTLALTSIGWSPSAGLAEVSRAIAAEEPDAGADLDPRFCTLALATVEPDGDGAEVVLSLGGHPRPMLVRASGEVTEVGVPGSLLGILDEPELHDVRLRLRPGDCLVMFSDGVTEARRGDEAFADAELTQLLGRLAGTPAGHVVHEVVTAVRAFSRSAEARDDVAVLALAVPMG
jgi:sigma-B regulation protein RsbU (phosphoserine phosphatase)